MRGVLFRDDRYLLDIGPRGDGVVTTGSVNEPTDIGAWMSTYGARIYGTTGSRSTRTGRVVVNGAGQSPKVARRPSFAGRLHSHNQ